MNLYSPLMTCPYNQSHQVLKYRMPYHLVKCEKNFPNVHLEICPFDATHRMPKAEYLHHLSICPDRKLLEQHKYPSEEAHGALRICPIEDFDMDRFTEKWDGDETPGTAASAIDDYNGTDNTSYYEDYTDDEELTESGAAFSGISELETLQMGAGRGFGRGTSLLSLISRSDGAKFTDHKPGSRKKGLNTSAGYQSSTVKELSLKETGSGKTELKGNNLDIANAYVAYDEDDSNLIKSWGRGGILFQK